MEIEIRMPDLGTTEAEIKLTQWLVPVGKRVSRGQPLFKVETDKAEMDVESFAAGVFIAVRVQPGDIVETGQVIAIIEGEGDPAPAARPPETPAAGAQVSPSRAEQPPPQPPAGRKGFFARNREKTNSDGSTGVAPVANTGGTPVLPRGLIDLGPAQRTVARRMQQSWQTVPHFTLQASLNAEPMLARRAGFARKILWDAFFVQAAGKALARFPRICFRFENDKLVPQGTDAVGVAVDLEGDLCVIPIADPGARSLEQISDEIGAAIAQIRGGDPKAREVRRACLTVSNLGVCNVESFTAIINPPESCILAIGRISPQPAVQDGRVVVQNRATLTLSADHRVVNGRYAADFLDAIVQELERA